MPTEILLPDLGDGIDSGDVLEVLVKEGQIIKAEQGVVELETDKATVEVPASHGGQVLAVHVRSGDTIRPGDALITVDAEVPQTLPRPDETVPTDSTPDAETSTGPHSPSNESAEPTAPEPGLTSAEIDLGPTLEAATAPSGVIPAGPAVRRFAREVGIDLRRVQGSGPTGRITREDVLAVVRQTNRSADDDSKGDTQQDDWGTVRVEKLSKIRRTIAAKMSASWSSAPRVTNFDDADISELEQVRQSNKADYAEHGIKLTSMPFIIKSVALALQDHPSMNAILSENQQEVVYKEYVNIGIAVDTERGLIVPSLRGAGELSIPDIARDLAKLAEKARIGNFSIDELRGSTFTISNLGAIGGTYSTPIINVPEVAILLVGRSRKMPVVVDDAVVVRLMLPLSLSYDHRLVDGATAARFLNDVISYLEAPSRLLLKF